MSDVLLERIAVALEKIATATQTVVVAEPAKRGKPKKEEAPVETAVVVEVEPTAAVAPVATTTNWGIFNDDEDAAAPTPVPAPVVVAPAALEPTKSISEQRAQIRSEMIALQKIIGPDQALQVLVKAGESQTLIGLKPEKFAAVRKAIAARMPE